MVNDLIRYDVLVKDALREVIKRVLTEVSKAGLPGEHHFFITFSTNTAGVKISPQLKSLYPEQMTIVIQHQFWDLVVNENYFEICLSFNNIAEKLVIPFAAIQCFYDPYASFEAAFNLPDQDNSKNEKTDQESRISNIHNINDPVKDFSEGNKIENDSQTKSATVVSLADFRNKKD